MHGRLRHLACIPLVAGVLGACGTDEQLSANVATAPSAAPSPAPPPGSWTDSAGIYHPPAERAQAEARKLFGKRYAGIWIDPPGTESISIGVANLEAADRDLWRRSSGFPEVTLVHRVYSTADLARFRRIATDYLNRRDAFCMMGFQYHLGVIKVVVRTNRSEQVRDRLFELVPRDAVRYSTSSCHFRAL